MKTSDPAFAILCDGTLTIEEIAAIADVSEAAVRKRISLNPRLRYKPSRRRNGLNAAVEKLLDDGMSRSEIAARLNVGPGYISSVVSRRRRKAGG
jgi:transposase